MCRRPGHDPIRDRRQVVAHSSFDMITWSCVSAWCSEVKGERMMDMSRPNLDHSQGWHYSLTRQAVTASDSLGILLHSSRELVRTLTRPVCWNNARLRQDSSHRTASEVLHSSSLDLVLLPVSSFCTMATRHLTMWTGNCPLPNTNSFRANLTAWIRSGLFSRS